MSEVRSLIRKILLEELEKQGRTGTLEKNFSSVPIQDNDDLNAFALKVLDLAEKSDLKSDIQSGKVAFTLVTNERIKSGAAQNQQSTVSDPVSFENGLVTEKDIAGLAEGTSSINVGKTVCFTPLAMDEIRRRRLNVKRISK
jgi:hypothetical protein